MQDPAAVVRKWGEGPSWGKLYAFETAPQG